MSGETQKKATIYHVEDERFMRDVFALTVETFGHEVVGAVGTVAEALVAIPDELRRLGVNLIVLDENVLDGTTRPVAEKARSEMPEVKIMTFTGTPDVTYGDVNIKKPNSVEVIIQAIDKALNM